MTKDEIHDKMTDVQNDFIKKLADQVIHLLKIEKQIKSQSAQDIVKKITQEAANLVLDGKIKDEHAYQAFLESQYMSRGGSKNDNLLVRSWINDTNHIKNQYKAFKTIFQAISKAYNQ